METIKIRKNKDESAYSAIGRYYVKVVLVPYDGL